MEVRKAPLSIRIIYWFTSFAVGILSLVFIASLVFNFLLFIGFFGDDLQLRTQLPVQVDILEKGVLHLGDQEIQVELVEATTKIHFINTPGIIAKKIGVLVIIVSFFALYLTWIFRTFIKNVKEGEIFKIENIMILKKLSYGLVGFWLFTVIYMRLAYYYIAKGLEFEYVKISSKISDSSDILILALFIWVLAHIFITGLKLQQEKDLTI